ncbi:hypothetical protein TNCV_3736121 [Trichonephila clavipes]|nr:hypothetical protein TNCV_3736121 [Trichonephila clavipes]
MSENRTVRLKNKRSILRTAVTNAVTKFEHELFETELLDINRLNEIFEILITKFESLKCVNDELEPLFDEVVFEDEYTEAEEYNDKVNLTKFRVNKRFQELKKNV